MLFSSQLPHFCDASANAYSSVRLYNSWQSNGSIELGSWKFDDSSIIRPIIVSKSTDLTFGFRFFSSRPSRGFGSEYYLVVFLLAKSLDDNFTLVDPNHPPIVVWCTNRDSLVSWNTSLDYNEGNLELKDTDDMNTGLYFLFVNQGSFDAYVNSDPPQRYIPLPYTDNTGLDNFTKIVVQSSNSLLWFNYTESSFEFMRLESTGQLNIYQVEPNSSTLTNLKKKIERLKECDYPNMCGNYGVSSGIRQCSCPGVNSSNYLTQSQEWETTLGCRPITPLACEDR
ncbi:hypothetical protein LguiA_023014 [Lonicera macranthoides]